MFLDRRKDTIPPILLSQKTQLDHRERGVYRPVDRVVMRLAKEVFSPSFYWNHGLGHTTIFDEHREVFFTQKLLYCIRTEGFLGTQVTGGKRSNILSRTHHVFNKQKIIIMSDGYTSVLRAFLFEPSVDLIQRGMLIYTNLCDIIQDSDERIAILESSYHLSLITSVQKDGLLLGHHELG